MLVVWGWRRYVQTLAMITLVCSSCQRPAAHAVRRMVTKFTLFWIPLFPVGSKYSLQCTFCGGQVKIGKEQADQLVAQAQMSNAQPQGQYPPQAPQQQYQQQPPQYQQPQPGQYQQPQQPQYGRQQGQPQYQQPGYPQGQQYPQQQPGQQQYYR
jgi:hypothetical protein